MSAARVAGRLSAISKFWESLDVGFKKQLQDNPNSIIRLLNIKGPDLLSKLVCSVIDRHYDHNMHTFTFSSHVLGVTLEDVLYLTGLPIQGKPVIYDKSLDKDAFERVFGEKFKGKTQLKFDEVKKIALDVHRPFKVRKIAVLLVMCECFISPNNNHHEIISQKVQLVEKVDDIDFYAWGEALLSYLYHGLEI
ncbi:PMD domain-containing protein [Heracleum sosnowskyi]|uniref:PMD domain-containing protein n=1 Tax=Heracleum sosnowskyi TaxID=360622 RepID=A0AAD8N3U1_9APIA|nr:PMD domain-containing protein [Heracleum sosnowskyi]